MGSTHQEFIVDMFTTFRGVLWKYNPLHTETVRGGAQHSLFSRVHLLLKPYCMLHAEFFCKSSQDFAFCRKTASQVGCGGRKETRQTVRSDIKKVQVHACQGWNSSCTSSWVFLLSGRRKPLKRKTAWCWTRHFSMAKYLLATVHCYSVSPMPHQAGPWLPPKYIWAIRQYLQEMTLLLSTMASCHAGAQHGIATLLSSKAHQCQKQRRKLKRKSDQISSIMKQTQVQSHPQIV